MKKLNKKEVIAALPRGMGRGRLTNPMVAAIGDECKKLKVGEGVLFKSREWLLAMPPNSGVVNAYLKRTKSDIKVGLKVLQKSKEFIVIRIV